MHNAGAFLSTMPPDRKRNKKLRTSLTLRSAPKGEEGREGGRGKRDAVKLSSLDKFRRRYSPENGQNMTLR